MTFTTNETTQKAVEMFSGFDTDTKLALLWYGYLDLKEQLSPADAESAEVTANAVFDNIKAMSKEEQLQAQRDIVNRANTDISRAYGSLSSSAQIDMWLKLAQAMEAESVINVPDDYELPDNTNDFVAMMKELEFEERINFTRSVVVNMGAK
ncbi:MAG: orange carotenoid protein N-terminal domain-containing protein [Cyanophyceae cyanobacterium]